MKLTVLYTTLILALDVESSIREKLSKCILKLPKHIYYSSDVERNNFESIITRNSNCNQKTVEAITDTIQGINGKIPKNYLDKILRNKNTKLVTQSKFITIEPLRNLITRNLTKNKNIKPLSLKHDIKNFIAFTESPLEIEFLKKRRGIIKGKNLSEHVFMYDYLTEVLTYTAKETLYPYSTVLSFGKNINVNKKKLWSSEKDQYLNTNDIAGVTDYELNNIVKKGTAIKISDVKLKKVINIGTTTSVILQSNGLIIKTTGVAKTSGRLGEFIEVKLDNKKTVRGVIRKGKEYYVKI